MAAEFPAQRARRGRLLGRLHGAGRRCWVQVVLLQLRRSSVDAHQWTRGELRNASEVGAFSELCAGLPHANTM